MNSLRVEASGSARPFQNLRGSGVSRKEFPFVAPLVSGLVTPLARSACEGSSILTPDVDDDDDNIFVFCYSLML